MKTNVSSDTCTSSNGLLPVEVEFNTLLCSQLTNPKATLVEIGTVAGGDIRADVFVKVGYVFDLTSGYALYSPSKGDIVLAWKTNQTLGSPAAADQYAAAFCVKIRNLLLPATGAVLMVSALVGTSAAQLPPVLIPGIQVCLFCVVSCYL
jgi:hypothetical protein